MLKAALLVLMAFTLAQSLEVHDWHMEMETNDEHIVSA